MVPVACGCCADQYTGEIAVTPPPAPERPPGTPRWVKVLAVLALVLVLAFVAVHLAGGGFRGHAPDFAAWLLWQSP